jgi:hypothetical protein
MERPPPASNFLWKIGAFLFRKRKFRIGRIWNQTGPMGNGARPHRRAPPNSAPAQFVKHRRPKRPPGRDPAEAGPPAFKVEMPGYLLSLPAISFFQPLLGSGLFFLAQLGPDFSNLPRFVIPVPGQLLMIHITHNLARGFYGVDEGLVFHYAFQNLS